MVARQALYAAKLLAGEMPQQIEEAFEEAGLSLFPGCEDDLDTHCSCPDWSNPCKHIAAVYYLIGEEFDRDPFLMFRLRGIEREELVQLLTGASGSDVRRPDDSDAGNVLEPEPLAADPAEFWHGGALEGDVIGDAAPPPTSAALARRLGAFPLWRGREPLLETLERVYRRATPVGTRLFVDDSSAGPK